MNETKKVKVNILFFAKVRELTNQSFVELEVTSKLTLKDLIDQIIFQYPPLEVLKENLIIALNQDYVNDLHENLVLKENDEIALIPPISGG